MEFVRSLGGLYRASGANDVPVTIAYERFRARLAQHYGVAGAQTADAATLAATLIERFGIPPPSLQRDLEACENAGRLTSLNPAPGIDAGQGARRIQRLDSAASGIEYNDGPYLEKDRGTIGTEHEHTDPEETPLSTAPPEPPARLRLPNIAATVQLLEHGRAEIGKVIAGQTELIDQALITVLSRGHALIEGVPGIAKTLLVKLLGRVLGLEFGRVQATPDLMPADILGTSILQAAGRR